VLFSRRVSPVLVGGMEAEESTPPQEAISDERQSSMKEIAYEPAAPLAYPHAIVNDTHDAYYRALPPHFARAASCLIARLPLCCCCNTHLCPCAHASTQAPTTW